MHSELFPDRVPLPVIGMIHLLPLPGSPGFGGEPGRVRDAMMRDAEGLARGGVDALLLENFGDVPFYPGAVPPHVVAAMAVLAGELRGVVDLPLGINVLRNDALAALGIAQAAGAAFVRVNVLAGARLTDQGLVEGQAHTVLRERARLGAGEIRIVADVQVKHSAPLAPRPLAEEAAELVERAGADALVVSGTRTGVAPAIEDLDSAREATRAPVLVGSGLTADNAKSLLRVADGAIVGTSVKDPDAARGGVDHGRVTRLMEAVRRVRAARER
jgi:hypothetical protein